MQIGKTTLENYLMVFNNVKHAPTLCPSNFTHRYIPKKNEVMCLSKPYMQMSMTAWLIMAPKWIQPKCPSVGNM